MSQRATVNAEQPRGALIHDALIYSSESEFTRAAIPFLCDGLDTGDLAVAVTTAQNIELLAGVLGSGGDVRYIDAANWYRRPLSTIAGYREVLDESLAAGAMRIRVIGEVAFGQRTDEQREWVRYESVLNRVFAAFPAWIMCPYDTRALPAEVIRSAARTHPHVDRGHGRRISRGYVEPRQMLSLLDLAGCEATEDAAALELTAPSQLPQARRWLLALAVEAGLSADRADSFVLAANEVISNALRHGSPPVRLHLWSGEGELYCDVADDGAGMADPVAGFDPPSPDESPEGGMGLWTARYASDALTIRLRPEGAAIRMSMRL